MSPLDNKRIEGAPARAERAALIAAAVRLEAFTIVWTIVEAIAAVVLGFVARSIALTAFGLDSGIETFEIGRASCRERV